VQDLAHSKGVQPVRHDVPAGSGCVISSRIGMGISVAGPAARPKSLREIMKEKESNEPD
jgi:hypothetical protein